MVYVFEEEICEEREIDKIGICGGKESRSLGEKKGLNSNYDYNNHDYEVYK